MKRILAAFLLLGVIFSGVAQAEGPDSDKQTGVYVGAKLGASITALKNRKFGQDAGGTSHEGNTYTWGGESKSMGSKDDTVFGGGLNVGYDFGKRLDVPIRFEIDYTLRDRATTSGSKDLVWNVSTNGQSTPMGNNVGLNASVKLQTLMANVWVDIPTGTMFKPYLGGGIGAAFIDYRATAIENGDESISRSKDATNFAWSLGGGLGCEFTDNWTLDLGYRYIHAGDIKAYFSAENGIMYSKVKRIESHDIMLGIRYAF